MNDAEMKIPLIPEARKALDNIKTERSIMEKRFKLQLSKLKKKYRAKDYYLTGDREFAYDGNRDFKTVSAGVCSFCEGDKSIKYFDEHEPARGYLTYGDCPKCEGRGELYLKYGTFSVGGNWMCSS
jgi:hypothetical protein